MAANDYKKQFNGIKKPLSKEQLERNFAERKRNNSLEIRRNQLEASRGIVGPDEVFDKIGKELDAEEAALKGNSWKDHNQKKNVFPFVRKVK